MTTTPFTFTPETREALTRKRRRIAWIRNAAKVRRQRLKALAKAHKANEELRAERRRRAAA